MNSPRSRSGLVLPGVTVALTPARAATSRLRRRYQERYRGRYRFPVLLFVIDAFVVACVLAVFGVGVGLSLWQPRDQSGLRLVFSAPPIVTATTLAFEAKVSAADARIHQDVRLRWVLPPGTQVVSSVPQADTQHEVLIGDLEPGEEYVARIAVRLFVPPGSVRIGFQLRSGEELVTGEELRPIVRSALHVEEILPPVRSTSNAHFFLLRNSGDTPLSCAHVEANGWFSSPWDVLVAMGGGGGTYLGFDEILPHDQRWFSIALSASQDIRVFCGETELERVPVVASALLTNPPSVIVSAQPSVPGQDTVVQAVSPVPLQLFVYHPLLREANDGIRVFDIASGTTQLVLPLDATKVIPKHGALSPHWFVMPVRRMPDGIEFIGPLVEQPITTPFSFQTEARYYALSGGQIGAGPLPPQIGQATRYWVQWKIAPTETDLSQVELRAKLAPHVTFTGQKALPSGGELAQEGEELIWRLPFLPASSAETSVAFELSLTPIEGMRDRTPNLLESARAQAFENRSGVTLNASAQAIDTGLQTDEKARGKGWVR